MNKILWFRYDLRVEENESFNEALRDGNTLPIFIFDENFFQLETSSSFHLSFTIESLKDLKNIFKEKYNTKLNIYYGDTLDILKYLSNKYKVSEIYSTHHFKNKYLRDMDIKIKSLCDENNISWKIYNQFGIQLSNRNGKIWSQNWNSFIVRKINQFQLNGSFIEDDHEINFSSISTNIFDHKNIQNGGRENALKILDSFIDYRSTDYQKKMSSPITGETACSRLSPHITYGNVSLREIYNKTQSINNDSNLYEKKKSINSFRKRLAWHCHFIQKFYDQPDIEYTNMNTAFDGIRENSFNEAYFEAWKNGTTGYPFVDACMRYLKNKGWINFRMRAMLVSFASYQLWLDWRITSKYLAKLFTDYEPGIHYSQFQMQSGTTGINAIRIYNPIKQSRDQDPDAVFIKKWIPELSNIPSSLVHEPWKLTYLDQKSYDIQIGENYPLPIVDNAKETKNSRDRIWKIKKSHESKILSASILKKHTSSSPKIRNFN